MSTQSFSLKQSIGQSNLVLNSEQRSRGSFVTKVVGRIILSAASISLFACGKSADSTWMPSNQSSGVNLESSSYGENSEATGDNATSGSGGTLSSGTSTSTGLLTTTEDFTSGTSEEESTSATNSSSTTIDTSIDTTTSVSECGNAMVEPGEVCDDGVNDGSYGGCAPDCSGKGPRCGDGLVQKEFFEACDDGNQSNNDTCTTACVSATCGDGYLWQGVEECDDKNFHNDDACTTQCTKATCGDGFVHAGVEVCDDGVNDNSYNSCSPDCKNKAPTYCGDKKLQKEEGEQCDGAIGLNGLVDVGCQSDCLFDFSKIEQIYCHEACSWGGPPGCDQADADILCKLITGNPNGKADWHALADFPIPLPGFSCGKNDGIGTNLGPMPKFGINKDVFYFSGNMQDAYPGKEMVYKTTITKISCGLE